MAVPWLAVAGVEYLSFRRYFAADLDAGGQVQRAARGAEAPVFALAVLACTLAGFAVTSAAGVNPAWAAFADEAVRRAGDQRR